VFACVMQAKFKGVAVCCSMLQYVAMCVAVCGSVYYRLLIWGN